MWKRTPSRREFLQGVGVAAGATTLGWVGCGGNGGGADATGGDDGAPAPGNGAPPPSGGAGVVVRHDVTSSEGQAMLDAYRAAIQAMQALDESDPTSWRAQARIHLDHCPHGNAFFLPWHRGYLHYFEQIVRYHSGDPSFALPYWDWTTHPALPDEFWTAPLLDTTRRIQQGQEIPATFVGPTVISQILAIQDFQTFASAYATEQREQTATGRLEGTPHNNVHTQVGGRFEPPPVGNMSTFWSPLDPIFWLHHCNVDRLWARWNADGHANGDDAGWRGFTFAGNFVDADGQPQDVVVEDVFRTSDLGYRYDGIDEPDTETAALGGGAAVVASTETAVPATEAAGDRIQVAVELPAEVRQAFQELARESGAPRTVRLTVVDVEQPAAAVPVRVYAGGADAAGGGEGSAAYLGTVSFFPIGEGAHGGPRSFLFDIGEQAARHGDGPLHVVLEPQPLEGATEAAPIATLAPTSVRIEVVEHR